MPSSNFKHSHRVLRRCTGLAGFVEYPTQELVSGLLPLDQVPLLANYTGTACIKPGMSLAGYNATNKIPGGLVRCRAGAGRRSGSGRGARAACTQRSLCCGRRRAGCFGAAERSGSMDCGSTNASSGEKATGPDLRARVIPPRGSVTATAALTRSRPGCCACRCPSTSWPSSRCLVRAARRGAAGGCGPPGNRCCQGV